MTTTRRTLLLLGISCGFLSFGLDAAHAQFGGPRQYYGGWIQGHGYHYRQLYFKPYPSYVGYRHHYVVYQPSFPDHYYFFNPYKRVYWGRCAIGYGGDGQNAYSLLAEADRRPALAQIPPQAFPPPGPVPALPETRDGIKLDLPPDDLPPAVPPPGGAPTSGPPAGAPVPGPTPPPAQPAP